MTYTLTVWGLMTTPNWMIDGPVESARGLSDRGVLELFDSVRAKGHFCVITDQDRLFVNPRDLGWTEKSIGRPC